MDLAETVKSKFHTRWGQDGAGRGVNEKKKKNTPPKTFNWEEWLQTRSQEEFTLVNIATIICVFKKGIGPLRPVSSY